MDVLEDIDVDVRLTCTMIGQCLHFFQLKVTKYIGGEKQEFLVCLMAVTLPCNFF